MGIPLPESLDGKPNGSKRCNRVNWIIYMIHAALLGHRGDSLAEGLGKQMITASHNGSKSVGGHTSGGCTTDLSFPGRLGLPSPAFRHEERMHECASKSQRQLQPNSTEFSETLLGSRAGSVAPAVHVIATVKGEPQKPSARLLMAR